MITCLPGAFEPRLSVERVVLKYPLSREEEQVIVVPSPHRIAHFGPNPHLGGDPAVWLETYAVGATDAWPSIQVRFFRLPTGLETVPPGAVHVCTLPYRDLIWHFYAEAVK